MRGYRFIVLGLGVLLATQSAAWAHGPGGPRVAFGISIGAPVYPRPWYGGYYGYYAPRPIYVEQPVVIQQPAPVYVQPAPVYVQPPATYQQAPQVIQQPPSKPIYPTPSAGAPGIQTVDAKKVAEVTHYMQFLNDPDEKVRSEAAIQLGRSKADRAVDPLAATLAGDKSPMVREAAAKALGLIGSPRALTVLTHSAQSDTDYDVRRSALFAVEIIKANQGY